MLMELSSLRPLWLLVIKATAERGDSEYPALFLRAECLAGLGWVWCGCFSGWLGAECRVVTSTMWYIALLGPQGRHVFLGPGACLEGWGKGCLQGFGLWAQDSPSYIPSPCCDHSGRVVLGSQVGCE